MHRRDVPLSHTRLMARRLNGAPAVIPWHGDARCLMLESPFPPLCRIIDHAVTDFDQPLVSMGAGEREIILLDPESSALKQHYQDLKKELSDAKSAGDVGQVLQRAMHFVRNIFPSRRDAEDRVKEVKDDGQIVNNEPVIRLETFTRQGVGVCRHHALLMCFLLYNLIKEGLLPPGTVHVQRDAVDAGPGRRGGHAWCVYRPIGRESRFYWVDSMQCTRPYSSVADKNFLIRRYGAGAVERCVEAHAAPAKNQPSEVFPDLQKQPHHLGVLPAELKLKPAPAKEEKIVALIQEIIESGKLEVLSSRWACFFWRAGDQINKSSGGTLYVPRCAKEIHNMVVKAKATDGKIDLTHLIHSISAKARIASNNNHRYRDQDTTQKFLVILRDASTLDQLHRELTNFLRPPVDVKLER
jgi:hypothetical protein